MNDLKELYTERYHNILWPIAERLSPILEDVLNGIPRINRLGTRSQGNRQFF